MPPHTGRAQPQPLTDGRGGHRPLLEQQLNDGFAGMPLTRRRSGRDDTPSAFPTPGSSFRIPQTHGFHNISVTEFHPAF